MQIIRWTDVIRNQMMLEEIGENNFFLMNYGRKANQLGHMLRQNSYSECNRTGDK